MKLKSILIFGLVLVLGFCLLTPSLAAQGSNDITPLYAGNCYEACPQNDCYIRGEHKHNNTKYYGYRGGCRRR
ncbi:hypothetical protein LJC10_05850 [Selenomonadales bacterium OttesenSCG-928-I06]|nr:hypothetical protein [Selenomonadales bacterium OttesenSCG-928-I06]